MNFSSTHPPAKNKDFNTLIHSASDTAKNMWSEDAWLHAGNSKMIIGHMLSFSKWPHERVTISSTVVFFQTQCFPFRWDQWLLTPELHRLLCEMLETVDANRPASMLGKHVVSKQKLEAGGVGRGGLTNCNWHWPFDPPPTWRLNQTKQHNTSEHWGQTSPDLLQFDPETPQVNSRRRLAAKSRSFCKYNVQDHRRVRLLSQLM